jgi:hypothetical protein
MHSESRSEFCAPDRTSNATSPMKRSGTLDAVVGRGHSRCELAFLDNGIRCAQPAVAYVEFHMVGHCQRFDCDARGNACGFVCAEHRDALEYTARCTTEEMQPTALGRLFKRAARCPTCGRALLSPSDILQVLVTL